MHTYISAGLKYDDLSSFYLLKSFSKPSKTITENYISQEHACLKMEHIAGNVILMLDVLIP